MLTNSPLLFLESLGTGEFMLVIFVVIVFFGSKKIPEMARVLGKGMREFKAAANNIQDEIQNSARELERQVNIENALKEDAVPAQEEVKATTDSPPKLIRADDPEDPKV